MLNIKRGFTLIELLVVIGIMAVLMAGVVALIDPVEKNLQAADARVQAVIASAATAEESYAATHDSCYAQDWATLNSRGELKTASASMPSGYSAPTFTVTTSGSCTAANSEAATVQVCAILRSKRYVGQSQQYWKYESSSGKTCGVASCATACP